MMYVLHDFDNVSDVLEMIRAGIRREWWPAELHMHSKRCRGDIVGDECHLKKLRW